MTKSWRPSLLEQRCLEQLDHAENWKLLNQEKPSPDEVLSWAPFRRILNFNLVVFVPLILLLAGGFGAASGMEAREFMQLDNLIPGAIFGVIIGGLIALFAANLYRLSWNRRARWLQYQTGVEDSEAANA